MLDSREGRSTRGSPGTGVLLAALLLLVLLAAAAEVIAIRGAIDTNASDLDLRYVVFVIFLGTLAIALRGAAGGAGARIPARLSTPRAAWGLLLACVALGVAGQFWLTGAIGRADRSQELNVALAGYTSAAQVSSSAFSAMVSARTTASALADGPELSQLAAQQRRRVVSEIDRYLNAVNTLVFSPLPAAARIRDVHLADVSVKVLLTHDAPGNSTLVNLVASTLDNINNTAFFYIEQQQPYGAALHAARAACPRRAADGRCAALP